METHILEEKGHCSNAISEEQSSWDDKDDISLAILKPKNSFSLWNMNQFYVTQNYADEVETSLDFLM